METLIKAERVKRARMMTGLTRDEIEKKYNIPSNTLRIWESASEKRKGITEKGVRRLLSALKQEGVLVDSGWIMYGSGSGPSFDAIQDQNDNISLNIAVNEESQLFNETATFLNSNPDNKTLIIRDECAAPFYRATDLIGARLYERPPADLDNELCLVEIKDGEMMPLSVSYKKKNSEFFLSYINKNYKNQRITLKNCSVFSIGPIIWHRRRDFWSQQWKKHLKVG